MMPNGQAAGFHPVLAGSIPAVRFWASPSGKDSDCNPLKARFDSCLALRLYRSCLLNRSTVMDDAGSTPVNRVSVPVVQLDAPLITNQVNVGSTPIGNAD